MTIRSWLPHIRIHAGQNGIAPHTARNYLLFFKRRKLGLVSVPTPATFVYPPPNMQKTNICVLSFLFSTMLNLTRSCLSFSSRFNDAIARLLLEGGADPNSVDEDRDTPLHYACSSGNVDIITMLLAKGADPTAADGLGRTPAERSTGEGVQQLLEAESYKCKCV